MLVMVPVPDARVTCPVTGSNVPPENSKSSCSESAPCTVMLTSAGTPVETLLMLIALTFGNRLSSPSSTAFSRIVIWAPTLARVWTWVPSKITLSLPSRAIAVNVNSAPTVSPDRVPTHIPSGELSRSALASGSWWLPRALLPATVTVTEAISAWLPFAEAMVSGPATRTATAVMADGPGLSSAGGPADGDSSSSSMHPMRDTRTISVASAATRLRTVSKTLMDMITGPAAAALQRRGRSRSWWSAVRLPVRCGCRGWR